MAQTKFKLNTEEEAGITHAHTHVKEQPIKKEYQEVPEKSGISKSIFSMTAGASLSVHLIKLFEILTPAQKTQLVENALKNDKTASCVIKETLIKQGIIEDDAE